jgi:guanylate kinase
MSVLPETEAKILLVISGPSGVGKDEVLKKVEENHPDMKRVVTYTSRPPRGNEVQGKDYHFISQAEFEEGIDHGEFLEYVIYRINKHGQPEYKGTKRKILTDVIEGHHDLAWRIDPSRTAVLDQLFLENAPDLYDEIMRRLIVTYIGIEDLRTLFKRRLSRVSDSAGKQEIIECMRADWQVWKNNQLAFNKGHVLINRQGQLDTTVKHIEEIITRKKEDLSNVVG